MGWLNNFLGVPPAGVPAQGQFGNAQRVPPPPAPGQPQPQNFGWPPAQPPLYFPMAPQPNLLPLQPVPQFRGFYGPDGVWHPWGFDPRWPGNGAQQQQPPSPAAQGPAPPTNTSSSPTQSGSSATDQRPTTQGNPTESDIPTPTPTMNPSASTAGQQPASTPREAVAQATLRRLGLAPPNTTTFDANASQASTSASASASAPPTVPAADAPSGQGESSRRDSSQPVDGRREAPSLIPLYDLFSRPPHPASYVPYGNHHASSLHPQANHPHARGPRSTAPRASGSTAPPLAELPATLTDEQLARLDHVTREGIDERLRVLEGVSGAVHRCIEELTRVRSVLPTPAPPPARPARAQAEERPAGEPAPGASSAVSGRQADAVAGASEGAPAPAPAVGPAQTPAPVDSESSSAA